MLGRISFSGINNQFMKSNLLYIRNQVYKNTHFLTRRTKFFSTKHVSKQKVVILGTGWASMHFFRKLSPDLYEIVVVSPRNYFTFTPLLPSVCSGSLSPFACIDPVRNFTLVKGKPGIIFYESLCTDIDFNRKVIICKDIRNLNYELSYDYLVIAIGLKTNTFGISGVKDHTFYLKEVEHAIKIRTQIINNFELARLPTTSNELRSRLLHFSVVGGGPTGVEFIAELADFIREDISKHFPELIPHVKLTIVEAKNLLLSMFPQSISSFTKKIFQDLKINVLLHTSVVEVKEDGIVIKKKGVDLEEKIFCGLVVWASGLEEVDLAKRIKELLPRDQANSQHLKVNSKFQLFGADCVYSIGDCCTVFPPKLEENAEDLYRLACGYNGGNVYNWLDSESKNLSKIYPQIAPLKWNFKANCFKDCDFESFLLYLKKIDSNYRSPSPTAQNARHEGNYLADVFNKYLEPHLKSKYPSAFNEIWSGSLAYVGNNQAVGFTPYFTIHGGFLSQKFWKLVYAQMQLSWRSRMICLSEWFRIFFLGRDVGRNHSK